MFACGICRSCSKTWGFSAFHLTLRYPDRTLLESLERKVLWEWGLEITVYFLFYFPRKVEVKSFADLPVSSPYPQAYELSTLTGTQVLLLVASETGHVYTFATRKLQPMITSETGKALIQTCLNSPDSPPRSDPTTDQRMSATGFEETDLTYQVSESDSSGETKVCLGPVSGEGRGGTVLAEGRGGGSLSRSLTKDR